MKKRIAVIVIIVCVIAAGVLLVNRMKLTAGGASAAQQETAAPAQAAVCVFCADTYLSIDTEGVVSQNSSEKPGRIPEISGIVFDALTYGKKAQAQEPSALEYAIQVARELKKHGIEASRLSYDRRMITVHVGQLEILLGKNENTEEKINDLSDFIDKLAGQKGRVYMRNANADNYGYTYRPER